jgi:hypothetical protein
VGEGECGDRAGGVRRRVGRGAVQHTEARPRGAVPEGDPAKDVAHSRPGAVGTEGRGADQVLAEHTRLHTTGAEAFGLVLAQGALSFGVGSTLISQALYAAPGAPTLAGGFATAALNVGAACGPWLGGAAIGSGGGYRSPVWVSAGLVAVALVAVPLNRRALRRRTPASWSV